MAYIYIYMTADILLQMYHGRYITVTIHYSRYVTAAILRQICFGRYTGIYFAADVLGHIYYGRFITADVLCPPDLRRSSFNKLDLDTSHTPEAKDWSDLNYSL